MQATWLRRSGDWIEQHPLLFALGVSVVVHVLFIMLGVTVLGIALLRDPSLLKQIARSPDKIIELTAQTLETAPVEIKTEPEREMPMLFIEVDPTRPGDVAPDKPKYYAAQNSLASNPDTKLDTDQPKIDGKRTEIIRAFEAPKTQLKPLQASRPQEAKIEAQPEKNTKQAKPLPNPAAQTLKPEKLVTEDQAKQERGDLEKLRPVQKTTPKIEESSESRGRPKTIAQAKAMLADTRPAGEKMQQDGGVKRQEPTSNLAAGASPLGQYDAKLIEAIKYTWWGILEDRSTVGTKGSVRVEFRLHADGHISLLRVTDNSVSEMLASFCLLAIDKPAPFEPWPPEVKRQLGANHRDVYIRFHY